MGLYDRQYMHNHPGNIPDFSGRKMLITLIIVNIICFFIFPLNSYHAGMLTTSPLALTINNGSLSYNFIWQIFTAGFLHADFSHILFNMWGLYLFGSMIAPHLSGKQMLILYLTGVVFGNLLFILFNLNTPGYVTLIGASGAVCAIMTAAATLEPERRLMIIFMPFTPIKTPTLVICYTVMEIIFELLGRGQGVAHLAHLGGFISGYIVMRLFFGRRLPWDPLRAVSRKIAPSPRPPRAEPFTPHQAQENSTNNSKVSQRELDALLDKLSNYGINSLSEYELQRLRRARKQMRGEE